MITVILRPRPSPAGALIPSPDMVPGGSRQIGQTQKPYPTETFL